MPIRVPILKVISVQMKEEMWRKIKEKSESIWKDVGRNYRFIFKLSSECGKKMKTLFLNNLESRYVFYF